MKYDKNIKSINKTISFDLDIELFTANEVKLLLDRVLNVLDNAIKEIKNE